MSEPFQKAPLMPETRSSATDHVMSQTSLNNGQRQMDSVLKSWGFRTFRDPFQENSSQGIEGNKGQKSTPSREVVCSGTSLEKEPPRVCPLERDDSSRTRAGITVRAGGLLLELKSPKSIGTQSFCHRRFSDTGVTKVGLGDLTPKWCKPLATTRFWALASRPTTPTATIPTTIPAVRFFDVLTARVFQEKKS